MHFSSESWPISRVVINLAWVLLIVWFVNTVKLSELVHIASAPAYIGEPKVPVWADSKYVPTDDLGTTEQRKHPQHKSKKDTLNGKE